MSHALLYMNNPPEQPGNPLHGVTLERMLIELEANMGWEAMGRRVRIRCFTQDPSVPSSLAFLRKTPWAREKVEQLYLQMVRRRPRGGQGPGQGPNKV